MRTEAAGNKRSWELWQNRAQLAEAEVSELLAAMQSLYESHERFAETLSTIGCEDEFTWAMWEADGDAAKGLRWSIKALLANPSPAAEMYMKAQAAMLAGQAFNEYQGSRGSLEYNRLSVASRETERAWRKAGQSAKCETCDGFTIKGICDLCWRGREAGQS